MRRPRPWGSRPAASSSPAGWIRGSARRRRRRRPSGARAGRRSSIRRPAGCCCRRPTSPAQSSLAGRRARLRSAAKMSPGLRLRLPNWAWPALILAASLASYAPAWRGAFVWDDDGHVTKPELRSLHGLARIWTEPAATQQYYPILHSAFWIEHRLWGDAPPGYHLLNILLHAAAAWLFVLVLRRLAVPGALLAGFIFALHPVCVESVAWVSEQKNTLSAVFYLAAAHVYLRGEGSRRAGSYAAATALFVLAVLSKTVAATLPAALLVIAWW